MGLEEINLSAYQYSEAVSDKFTQICEPLFKLGVKYFNYHKIFKNGSYLIFNNHPEFLKAYLHDIATSNISNIGPIFTETITLAMQQPQLYFMLNSDIMSFDPNQEKIIKLYYDFDIWNAFFIFKTNANFIEVYAYSMTRSDTYAYQFYLNNLHLLEHFVDYFNERATDLIDCKDQAKLVCFKEQFDSMAISQEDHLARKIEHFLQETQLSKRLIKGKNKDLTLSKREAECLEYLALGKSMKEIGKTLELSPRTIEFYLRNIKNKTGIRSKEEIIVNFIKNNKNGFKEH